MIFRTRSLHLASYILAKEAMAFEGAELDADGKCTFKFDDKDGGMGDHLYWQFNNHGQCEANLLFASVTHLRRVIDRLKTGDIRNEHQSHPAGR